jgi:hypothetical protein
MPTQSSDTIFWVYVLQGTNLYPRISTIYFHWSSLYVSWHQNYNTLTVDKSSNHTLSLHRPTSNSFSTTNFPWLSLTANCLTVTLGTLLYSLGTDTHQETQSLLLGHTGYHVIATVVLRHRACVLYQWSMRGHDGNTSTALPRGAYARTCPSGYRPAVPSANP